MSFQSFEEYLKERKFDPGNFPDKLPSGEEEEFLVRGTKDGESKDDRIAVNPVRVPAEELKPTQEAIFLGKSLGMAIGGIKGGDLDAIISRDGHILDGHHRWAATIFNDPNVKVGGVQVAIDIEQLVPVLRLVGDALDNERRGNPGGGDKNIFEASMEDVEKAVYEGEYMNPEFYDAEKSREWYEQMGREIIEERLNMIQSKRPGSKAPPRQKMPVIDPEEIGKVKDLMKKGKVDVFAPYAEQ